MELAHAAIDPHIAGAGVEERIARVAETGDVKMRRLVLVVDADIDAADTDDVADILGGAVVGFVEQRPSGADIRRGRRWSTAGCASEREEHWICRQRTAGVTGFERRGQPVASRRKFLLRMGLAIGLWLFLTVGGLAIGIGGYAYFEGMSFVDAFVNAATNSSGMVRWAS